MSKRDATLRRRNEQTALLTAMEEVKNAIASLNQNRVRNGKLAVTVSDRLPDFADPER